MSEDETRGQGGRSSEGPDRSFIKKLEDDSLWADDDRSRVERRAQRHARLRERNVPRSRRTAVAVLVLAAVLVIVIGLEASGSNGSAGGGPTVPFSVLTLQNNATTTTDAGATSSTSPSSTTALTTSTTVATTTAAPDTPMPSRVALVGQWSRVR